MDAKKKFVSKLDSFLICKMLELRIMKMKEV